jgi:predicted Zn-dependent protease
MKAAEKRKSTATRHKSRVAAPSAPKVKQKARLTPEQEKTYREYEHAVGLVYKQEYEKARSELRALAEKHATDREFADRIRIYLGVCEARLHRPSKSESSDLYFQALVQYNEGEYDEALKLLEKAAAKEPNSPEVVYLTACAHLAHGEREEGLRMLRDSIRLDVNNRYRALNDPDLEEIRTAEDFVDALGDEEPN